jgi:uncharacterized protein
VILESAALAIACGTLVGLALGALGGGGSVLATPLLVYVVGVADPHVAIGTATVAVSVNAFANLIQHARRDTVKWPCAIAFALAGVVGAAIGAQAGQRVQGQLLLFLLSAVMLFVAWRMAFPPTLVEPAPESVRLSAKNAPRVLGFGLAVGLMSGFFGVGGGFLALPGLVAATSMPMLNAIGSSLLSVGAFSFTTAVSYTVEGRVAWAIAAEFILGGVLGGLLGLRVAQTIGRNRQQFGRAFAAAMVIVALTMAYRSGAAMGYW